MSTSSIKTNWGQFIPLVTVFFFWGFVAASNDILIPVFKKAFDLTQGQSQLVSVAFYVAYTVGSIIYMIISFLTKGDLINRIGYKNSLALGLTISALGTLLFYPAANMHSFPLMLSGLFIVALGFSLQQTVANPLAIALGPITTGSQRLTLAGGINNFGTTIGPLIVSFAIFGSAISGNTEMSIESVKTPYLVLGAAFLLVAGAFAGPITVKGLQLDSTQADKAVLQALKATGATIDIEEHTIQIGPAKDSAGNHTPFNAFEFDATDCPDLFPPLVALASVCDGITILHGVSRLAHKESDRGLTLQTEFAKLGIRIELDQDRMLVYGGTGIHGAEVFSQQDHRIAMACGVVALCADGPISITDAEAVNKSYTDFFKHLQHLGAKVDLDKIA